MHNNDRYFAGHAQKQSSQKLFAENVQSIPLAKARGCNYGAVRRSQNKLVRLSNN
jgi:hypothetical protein